MATNDTVVLYFKLSDLGETIKGGHKDLKAFKATFDSLQKDMNKPTGKGKGGWKNAMMGGDEYDVARGSAGATGASGRDFANQARGLDGLVRLYATYAANLFAAGAAFRALSSAADTTNMIKGMDQLGAASGQALGTLSKRLVDVTDGSISMREAMEATAKGTAAGLSSSQMLQLGEVANKASKALGVAMPDAISRLTRGISKLEPELLDELGLFTKIDPAVEAYARSIGKATGSLTDFERRQAFATAVLKEGLDKFGAIDIAANPYDKLLASLQNLGQGALEIVNKALGPLVNVLAQSPTALLAVLTAIGVTILKSAIPALGHYRENLKNAANESRMVFTQIYADQQEKISEVANAAGAAAELAYKKSAPTLAKISELEKTAKTFTKGRKDYSALAGKDPFALTSEEIKSLDNRAKYLASRNAEEATRLKEHITQLKALRTAAAAAGEAGSEGVIAGTLPGYTTPGSNDITNKRILNKLSSETIRSATAETQAVYGSREAWKKLNEQIASARAGTMQMVTHLDENGKAVQGLAPKMDALNAGYTRLAGGIGIAGQKLGSLISAFGPWGIAIGLAVEALSLLDSWMSKTGKETAVFDKAIKTSSESIANTGRTLDTLEKKSSFANATISGFFALANASREATDSIEAIIDAQRKLARVLDTSTWDKWKNSILSLFDKDVTSTAAEALANQLDSQLRLFTKAGLGDEAAAAFKEATGTTSLDVTDVTKAFKTNVLTQEKFVQASKKLDLKLAESSSNLQAFKTSTDSSTKSFQEFIQSTANTNPLFKLGASLQDISLTMSNVLKGSIGDVNAALKDLLDNPEKAARFGQVFVQEFVSMRKELDLNFQSYNTYSNSIIQLDQKIADKRKELASTNWFQLGETGRRQPELQAEISELEKDRRTVGNQLASVDMASFTRARELFIKGMDGSFREGANIIDKALGQAAQKAAMTIAQARSGALSGERAAIESNKLKGEELKIQLAAIDLNIQLITSQESLTAAINKNSAEVALSRAVPGSKEAISAEAQVNAFTAFQQALIKGPDKSGRLAFNSIQEANAAPGEQSTEQLEANKLADAFLKQLINKVGLSLSAQGAAKQIVQGQQAALGITGERERAGGRLQDISRVSSLEESISQQKLAQLNTQNSINNAATEASLMAAARIENDILENKQKLERLDIQNKLNDAAKQAEATNEKRYFEEVAFQTKLLNLTVQRQKLEFGNKAEADRLKVLDLGIAKEKLARDTKTQADENALKMVAAQLGAEQEMYNVQLSLGMIYGQQAETQRKSLESSKLSNEIAQSELSLAKQRADVLAEIDNRLARLSKEAPNYAASKEQIEAERKAAEANFASQKGALDVTNDGRRKALDLTQSLTDRQLAYGEVFKQSFDSMGNAIIEFTKTGKLNFAGMIDSMIEGLIRYEMAEQSKMLYSAFRPGLMTTIGNIFGFAPTITGGGGGGAMAKGGVYDAGLQTFAKGGMFTNSIVDSPTLFKFAKGTGLMGEAGPEAIMPLKRDSNGNLGVRAGGSGGNVDVVVNNYGSEKAETRETTDSRGNRKIEVIIGDMTAGEIARNGSASQKAIRGTFGLQPQLIRR
jgi:lambda family phage tail tape measure protein